MSRMDFLQQLKAQADTQDNWKITQNLWSKSDLMAEV